MYIDQYGNIVPPVYRQYTGIDDTTYPAGFPREDIPGLVWQEDPPIPEPVPPSPASIKEQIIQRTQERLDTFAQERGYDSILSACTYANSTIARFRLEGQYAVDARDATWSTLYAILIGVEAGTIPIPTGFDDVLSILPALAWPNNET